MVSKIFRAIGIWMIVAILTVLTQTGGVVLLLCFPLFWYINKKTKSGWKRRSTKFMVFVGVYMIFTLLIIPGIAKPFGRIPLPMISSPSLKPLSIITCLTNRHYVRPDLLQLMQDISAEMSRTYPKTITSYLDANFPFWEGFPLIPHLSHSDGKKIDIAFLYKDKASGELFNQTAPTWLGYGSNENPRKGETDMPSECKRRGYKIYNFISRFAPDPESRKMVLDKERTAAMIRLIAQHRKSGKIFLEPHLKTRLEVSSYPKIRFHGCQAVRHDDHLHLQL